ncbi:MAG TPA: fused MFS/spermidine synthase, partial [Gammaproteobacteria bacterium]
AWMDEVPSEPGRMTFVISASNGPEMPEVVYARRGLERQWLRVTEPMRRTGTPMAELPLLTDDFVPVERLVSGFFFSELGR